MTLTYDEESLQSFFFLPGTDDIFMTENAHHSVTHNAPSDTQQCSSNSSSNGSVPELESFDPTLLSFFPNSTAVDGSYQGKPRIKIWLLFLIAGFSLLLNMYVRGVCSMQQKF